MSAGRKKTTISRLIDWAAVTSDFASLFIITTSFIVMILSIIFRYILNDSLIWADELLVWSLVWIVMLGSVGVMAQWRHVYVPVVVLALPMRWRVPTLILSKIVTMIFIALLVYYGFQVFFSRFHSIATGLQLSTRWEKLAIPVGCALMLWVGILQIIVDIDAWLSGNLEHFANYGDADLEI